MTMRLANVVPFGRCLDEYRRMFDLSPADLAKTILGVGDGPASFNAEASRLGASVVSVDPLYSTGIDEIRSRVVEASQIIMQQVVATETDWEWSYHKSPKALAKSRAETHSRFYEDYARGREEGRYCPAELPHLPFADDSYELGLCSHLLFLYSDQLDRDFHLRAVRDLLRVCNEVRVFPLLDLNVRQSPHLEPVVAEATRLGFCCERSRVKYALQRGGDEMLRIRRK